jgi:hypothetical protein
MIPVENSPLEYVFQHLQVVGWPAICWCAWKVSKYFERVTSQASKTIGQIDLMATNHFPHMEASLGKQDDLMHSMDTSLKTIADNSRRRREDF